VDRAGTRGFAARPVRYHVPVKKREGQRPETSATAAPRGAVERIVADLAGRGSVLVAYSGGVDSAWWRRWPTAPSASGRWR
jgi:hypothetical protein